MPDVEPARWLRKMMRAFASLAFLLTAPRVGGVGEGGWADIPVEPLAALTVAEFHERYSRPSVPVILRADLATLPLNSTWDVARLTSVCGDGQIIAYRADNSSRAWGGFADDHVELPFRRFAAGAPSFGGRYGFDLFTRCDCPALLRDFRLPAAFAGDLLALEPLVGWPRSPGLLVGPRGTRSAMHVDAQFLPFWITVLSGEKLFRLVSHDDWTRGFAPQIRAGGAAAAREPPLLDALGATLARGVDGFDDAFVARELIRARGATVFNGTLRAGDTLYVPVVMTAWW